MLDAADPDEWLEKLAGTGVVGARLQWTGSNDATFSDRMTAGLAGGGGLWFLETLGNDGKSSFWSAEWQVWNREARERRIWRVVYRVVRTAKTAYRGRGLENAVEELREALLEIADFSRRHQCDPFTAAFESASAALSSTERSGYHRDLAPDGILTEADARVLDAVQSASVFGGMGSWNDLGFDGDARTEYERVSERTFQAINAAVVAAVNGFATRRRPRPPTGALPSG